MSDSSLGALVEEQLGSVVFVVDYLQLDFGDARFTAYVWPMVTIGGATLRFGDPGYRDALCEFITHEVTSTEESPEAGLTIRFDFGELTVNPEPTDLSGPRLPSCSSTRGRFARGHGRCGDQVRVSSHNASGPERHPHLGTSELHHRGRSGRPASNE